MPWTRRHTRTDRSRSNWKNKSKGRAANATTPKPKDAEKQRKEGRCFTCDKQGHISRNCPDKKPKQVKARKAETEDSNEESVAKSSDDPDPDTFIRMGQSMKEEDKIKILRMAVRAERGEEGAELDF